ncbi:uncharacterized protein N7506_009329 [Penicillium brevicompactum]|uniref:uncharacterized protein n=1 Tax=Penicillium brevicompactum TaxID=5074 RepID=UPI002541C2E1|nr:uncharacterized protein N7506_009329 [Penicillium brevicompactum]KAJ5326227.1 hypothetical protein N7506_009329 [Penicillium brevicompactum]
MFRLARPVAMQRTVQGFRQFPDVVFAVKNSFDHRRLWTVIFGGFYFFINLGALIQIIHKRIPAFDEANEPLKKLIIAAEEFVKT